MATKYNVNATRARARKTVTTLFSVIEEHPDRIPAIASLLKIALEGYGSGRDLSLAGKELILQTYGLTLPKHTRKMVNKLIDTSGDKKLRNLRYPLLESAIDDLSLKRT